jgi:Gpi18-like mannosyltransferase
MSKVMSKVMSKIMSKIMSKPHSVSPMEHEGAALSSWQSALWFVCWSFLISRIVILIVFQGIAPYVPMPPPPEILQPLGWVADYKSQMGWELFTHWDGKWYEDIATRGYTYDAKDLTKIYSIAFLPMYAATTNLVMRLGLPFAIAGTLVNNLSFLGANYVLYRWVEEFHGRRLAQWSTIAMTCFPYSIFGTVAYTDGLFLVSTTISLRAFDKGQYGLAALSGMVASEFLRLSCLRQ